MPLAVSLRFDFQDSAGKTSFTKVRVPNGFNLSDYVEFAEAAAQVFANATVGVVRRVSICIGIDISGLGLKALAGGLADVAHKAYLSFSTAVAGFTKRLKLPTLDATLVQFGSDSIITTDIDVAPFISAMENGIVVTGGTISPCDARENDITTLNEAYEQFRKT